MVNRSKRIIGESVRNRETTSKNARRLPPSLQFEWVTAVTDEQWATYRDAIHALRQADLRFLLGGGFALATYIGRWRNTKDIDFYIMQEDRDKAVAALTKAGFTDLFERLPYDRKWIFRSTRDGVIVDIIWAMANQRAQTDEQWFERAPAARVRGEPLSILPMEEFLWCKLYIMQRDHCDWTDVFNLIYAVGAQLDWNHLLARLDEDWPLLKGMLTVYDWLCPEQARELPRWLRAQLELPMPGSPPKKRDHIRLLDTRGWFAAILPKNKPLEV
ncbi:MAG TPA: nucleotidyltransferase [Candidatus Angelobacter sp.]|nr:nucleotidyltransferase [Candidatus Angelobacter sp.]